jgi:hypothetical protein
MVTSSMCMDDMTCFITSTGHGDPAMIPVRNDDRSKSSKFGRASSAMNMVGTPYRLVHRSACTASSTASGSKPASGITMHAPCVVHARLPSTIPKQW